MKLELWESVILIIIFGLPLTYAYAYASLRQSVAGNSTFRGIVFCNLGTFKTIISKFVTTANIVTTYIFPIWSPRQCSRWTKTKKRLARKKSLGQQCINSFLAHKLSHDRWLWFFFWALTGPYPTLRFGGACGLGGGGGVVTRIESMS